uniref:Dendritic cell-specific transmembrane protein-like domain-containing protein n=1 Tax=Strongyloides stercoralis TaxID=6248 RepID=A0A0K0EN76_STRER
MDKEDDKKINFYFYNQEDFDIKFSIDSQNINFWFKLYSKIWCSNIFYYLKEGSINDLIPGIKWIKNYEKRWLMDDIFCGILLGMFSISEALSCGHLTTFGISYGLYTSFFTPLIYAFLGTSKKISLGMFYISSLLISKFKDNIENEEEYDTISNEEILTTITFTCGIVMLIFHIFNLHYFLPFFSQSIIKGLTTGVAFKVFLSQLPTLLGIKIEKKKLSYFNLLLTVRKEIENTNIVSFYLSFFSFSFFIFSRFYLSPICLKKFGKQFPFELIFIILGGFISATFNFKDLYNIEIIGEINNYLPSPILPNFSIIQNIIFDSTVIALVNYLLLYSPNNYYSDGNDNNININQEIRGMIFIYMTTSFFNCHPSGGCLLKSNIISKFNIKSQLHSIISSLVVLCTILWCTFLLSTIPKCFLSSILIASTIEIFLQFKDLFLLFKHSPFDWIIWISTFLFIIFFDTSIGLFLSVIFSLLIIILQIQHPKILFLGKIKETNIYKDIRKYKIYCEIPLNIEIFCFNSPLLYINIEKFNKITKEIIDRICNKCQYDMENNFNDNILIQFIILDCTGILFIDYDGIEALNKFYNNATKIGITVYLSSCNDTILNIFEKFKIFEKIPKNNFFLTTNDAVKYSEFLILKMNDTNL